MPLIINWENKIIQVTSPDISVDAQTLHDFVEDSMATARGQSEDDILKPEGKIEDPTNPGVYSQIILILSSFWQIQFWQGSGYTKVFGAKIVGGVSDQPLKATGAAGDISVLESPVDGLAIATGGGGGTDWTPAERAYILSTLAETRGWAEIASSNTEGLVSGTDWTSDERVKILSGIEEAKGYAKIGAINTTE